MPNLLMGKCGEGYDIHVLRNQALSKVLDSSLIDFNYPLSQFPLPDPQGAQVDITTGVGTASPVAAPQGGGLHAWVVFRPSDRCRLRSGFDLTIQFCHVCRYIIVDTIDAKQEHLDSKFYDKICPA